MPFGIKKKTEEKEKLIKKEKEKKKKSNNTSSKIGCDMCPHRPPQSLTPKDIKNQKERSHKKLYKIT